MTNTDFEQVGNVRYFHNLTQGSDEWLEMRLGILTASELSRILTPTLKIAANADAKLHTYDLLAQRITQYVEGTFVSYDMERGKLEEVDAKIAYSNAFVEVKDCGFIINDRLGFPIGCSPDGLVGKDGGLEIKSRMAKHQMKTIVEHVVNADNADCLIPKEFMLQVQGSLFVTERPWWDFVSYSNGLNMVPIRVEPIAEYQDAIAEAATKLEATLNHMKAKYLGTIADETNRIIPVERIDYSEEIRL